MKIPPLLSTAGNLCFENRGCISKATSKTQLTVPPILKKYTECRGSFMLDEFLLIGLFTAQDSYVSNKNTGKVSVISIIRKTS